MRPTFFLTRWLFLRLLGVIYLIAFLSLWTQINGLIGSDGILPAERYLSAVREQVGLERYLAFPTLCWLNDSDAFLHLLCGGGVFLSLLLIIGVAPVLALTGLWLFYLSLVSVGQSFLSFQWDALLLETGFLAIFFRPASDSAKNLTGTCSIVRRVVVARWLLFRLMFASGVVKLMSGDPTWGNLTALNFHYETQPLPTVLGWYAHHLPEWFPKAAVAGMFGVEIVVPFLIFAPRRLRFLGAIALVALQLLIAATGNYCFFNLLTVALCVLLFDDVMFAPLSPNPDCQEVEAAFRNNSYANVEASPHWCFGGVYTTGERDSDDRDVGVARGVSADCSRRSEVGRPISRSKQLWALYRDDHFSTRNRG